MLVAQEAFYIYSCQNNKALKMNRLITLLVLQALICSFGTCPVFGAGWKVLPGHVPRELSLLKSISRLPATNQLRLAIGVPLPDPAGLDAFLAQVNDPASPNYRQFLTREAFAARFSPTEKDYAAVMDFARTNGLTITATHGNRLVLDVMGPAAAMEKAFHITLRTYQHPTEARSFFAPDTEPSVAADLPVADIQGLSDYSKPRPKLIKRNSTNAISKNGSAPGDPTHSYFGDDFRNAYVPGTTLTGAGQVVGLFEFDGYYANDIAAYAQAAGGGRTSIVIQPVLLDGYDGVPTSTSGNGEVSLDIDMAMAIAPGLAKIMVFEAGPNGFQNDVLSAMAASSTVKNLSCSWGWSGGPTTTTDAIFQQMMAQGQSFLNASGDADAFTTGANSVNGVDNPSQALAGAPSSCPYITQVGGTTLTMNGTGASYASETVWNWGGGSGSGGGISSYYSIPSWQKNISNLASRGGSTTYRNIPDVALTADNVYVVSGGSGAGTGGWGGTSCAAPLWAGFMALVNQQAAASGNTKGIGLINPAIYTIAAGPSYATCFHDITTGDNTWSSSPNLFYAMTGYDLCTGLGTPTTSLINALAGPSDSLVVTPLSGAATGVAGGPFTMTSGSFLLTNASSSSLTWDLFNTSAWLTLSATSGTLAAAGQTELTCSLATAVNSLAAGTYVANLIFSNATSHVTQSGQFTLQVNAPLVVSPTNGFVSAGPVGGPFGVTSQDYTLTNLGVSSLSWSLVNTSSWSNASTASSTLAGGAQTGITVSLTTTADSLANGTYTANVLLADDAGVVASLPFTLNVGQPIVNNGGFETGDFTGWNLNGDNSLNVVTNLSDFIHSGSYGVALGQASAMGYLYQTLATSPGQNYLLSLWIDNPVNSTGATPNQFLVQWNGTTIFNRSNIPFIGWTNLQFVVTATNTSTVLQFGFKDSPYYLGLDDISVTPVATPPSLAQQPQSQIIPFGSNASFSVTATGTSPLSYQWWMVALQQTNALAGQTSNLISIPSATSANAGSYFVVVSSDSGSVTSSVARLTVLPPQSPLESPLLGMARLREPPTGSRWSLAPTIP